MMCADEVMGSRIRHGYLQQNFAGGQPGHMAVDTVTIKRLLSDYGRSAGGMCRIIMAGHTPLSE